MLVNSLPTFSFKLFASLEDITKAVAFLVGDGIYTLHCAHASSRKTQLSIAQSECNLSVSLGENAASEIAEKSKEFAILNIHYSK